MPEALPVADWSVIHDRLSAEVGKTVRRELGVQTALQFRRFAVASGLSAEPGPADSESVEVVAPPLYLSAVLGWEAGPVQDLLRPDGSEPADMAGLPVEGLRLMGAGQSLEFLAPVVSGRAVNMELSVEDVDLKHGRSGSFIVISLLRRYFDAAGTELVRCHEKFIAR